AHTVRFLNLMEESSLRTEGGGPQWVSPIGSLHSPGFMGFMPKLSALSLENNTFSGMIPIQYAFKTLVPVTFRLGVL
ncbi:unnamed protein product, partial [Ilex paraguariensis]